MEHVFSFGRARAAPVVAAALLLCSGIRAQGVWQDQFADSTSLLSWTGDSVFAVENGQLRLRASGAGEAFLAHPSTAGLSGSWKVAAKLDFNPSSSNFARLWIMKNGGNGYAWLVGGTTDDRLRFGRMTQGVLTELWSSPPGWLNVSAVEVVLTAVRSGPDWSLSVRAKDSIQVLTGTAVDSTWWTSTELRWENIFTTTRADRFYLDSVEVDGMVWADLLPPQIIRSSVPAYGQVKMKFNEPLATTGSWILQGVGSPDFADWAPGADSLTLFWDTWPHRFSGSLLGLGLTDSSGNTGSDSVWVSYHHPLPGELVISEIMADPSPPASQPEVEYLELANLSGEPLELTGWSLVAGNKTYALPPVHVDSFLVLTALADTAEFPGSAALSASGSWLANDNLNLELLNPQGERMDWVNTTYLEHDLIKADGGWSLEKINLEQLCFDPANWAGNLTNGGTPGGPNIAQIPPDFTLPAPLRLGWLNDTLLEVLWNQGPENLSVTPVLWPDPGLTFSWADPLTLWLKWPQPPVPGATYLLRFDSLENCRGDRFEDTLLLGSGLWPEAEEVWLTEVLYDPLTGCPAYVEVYNNSDHLLDLRDLRLGLRENGHLTEVRCPSPESVLFPPGTYRCWTKDVMQLGACHRAKEPGALVAVEELPSFGSSGELVLLRADLEPLDRMKYGSFLYHENARKEGVSLERYGTDAAAPWFPATETAAYGTPGYANSQEPRIFSAQQVMELPFTGVSPNGDGFQDVLEIHLRLPGGNHLADLLLVDERGVVQRSLALNAGVGDTSVYYWDGRSDSGATCGAGPYVIWLKVKYADGKEEVFREVCAVVN